MLFFENQYLHLPSSNVQSLPQLNRKLLQSKGFVDAIYSNSFPSNKYLRLKNCKIFIRNFEACVVNASHFHNSADRLRFDLPTTEFTLNLHRNNQVVLSTDLGDVLLDLSILLRFLNHKL